LTSGDILLYESSKCFHGRPRTFNGSWYSSVFAHYYPKHGYKDTFNKREKVYAIPPHWNDEPTTHYETPITMHGTTMEEPSCPNGWCETQHTKKWSGPGEEGFLVVPTGEKIPFEPKKIVCEDINKECTNWVSWPTNECDKNPIFMLKNCRKSCNACSVPIRDEL
jgi:hypothetical protein